MDILNLYAGVGGNRKLWDGDSHNITAVEINEEIADIYRDNFPSDQVVVGDAHSYLEDNFKDFDFIWSSPPCPSHSKVRKMARKKDGSRQNKAIYPDLKLWQEIIFLRGYFKGDWVVENVKSWYDPLLNPQESNYHYFWSNFNIPKVDIVDSREHYGSVEDLEKAKGFDLSGYNLSKSEKIKILRNCVDPKLGKVILESRNSKQVGLERW